VKHFQLEASRRATFLDSACEGDDEFRDWLDSLVAAYQQAESFIEVPALAMAAEAFAEEARSMVGSRLMHYQISAPDWGWRRGCSLEGKRHQGRPRRGDKNASRRTQPPERLAGAL
jgi:hypothetical protein